ncbi:hypothetical protein D4764_06G0000500 [Takifugu flavidus]|uniref:Uncharacterized protein n=1 Tax=Takifugu flavidus TaxID=433684 RepID=A0A5C6MYM2_9TELE|nr:hypothetical protein D4764_06G0000500 [Takifugu flavidus]
MFIPLKRKVQKPPQMPMLPCNSCLTMCPTKCCHPMEGRGSEEEGGFGLRGTKVLDSFEVMASAHVSLPPSPEPPGSQASVSGRVPIGAAG